jgi:hypothetical protein
MYHLHIILEQYEMLLAYGEQTGDTTMSIYKHLINEGLLYKEMLDSDFTADTLLIKYRYEFANEESLEALVEDLAKIANMDNELDCN